MEFLNKFIHKKITNEDLGYLNQLLKSDLALKSCVELIENKSNEDLFKPLIKRLDKGEVIEKVIGDYLPNDIAAYMNNLMKNLSFKESLELALLFDDKSKKNLKRIEKATSYPLILLFISLTAVFLFDAYGLDSILNLMKSLDVNTFSFEIIRIIIKIIVYIFYIGFIIISSVLLYFLNKKRITLFYLLLTKYFQNSLVKAYFTEDFVSLFIICLKLGYKTKDSLKILKSLKNKPLVSFLAFHLDESLLKGDSLKEAASNKYYDETLQKFINVAAYSLDFTSVLDNYVELANMKIENKMKKYTNILQAFSYIGIGIVIVFIYEVLFLPMQALSVF